MKLKTLGGLVKKFAGFALRTAVPAAGPILDGLNAALPGDKQLPPEATGKQVEEAIKTLPPEQQTEILSKQIDIEALEIRSHEDIVLGLAELDKPGSSTRPQIADRMAWAIYIVVLIFVAAWAFAIFTKDAESLEQIKDSWQMIAAFLFWPATIVLQFFGKRSTDKSNRMAAATGQPLSGLGNIIGMFKGKK